MEIPEGMFDIHICGLCKEEFHDVEIFMQHKKRCPAVAKLIADMQEKKKKQQLHPEHREQHQQQRRQQHQQQHQQQQLVVEDASSFPSSLCYVQQQHHTYQQLQIGTEGSSLPSVAHHSQSLQLQVRLDPASSQPAQQVQQHAALLQQHQPTEPQHLLLEVEAHPQELVSGDLSGIQQQFSCPTSAEASEAVVDFAEMPKGEEVGSIPLQHQSALIHGSQFVMQTNPSQDVPASVASVGGSISNLSEMSLSLLPARSDEFAFSDAEIPKSQQQQQQELMNPQASMFLNQAAQRKPARGPSGRPSHRRKSHRGHHTNVVHHHHPARQSEQTSLMHAVNETIAEADMEIQSQQLMFSASKERAKSLMKQSQGKGEGGDPDSDREMVDYQFDQNLDKYVLDQGQDLSHGQQTVTMADGQLTMQQIHERLEIPATAGVMLESQDSDSDLLLPASESEARAFRQTIIQDSVSIHDESMLVSEAPAQHEEEPHLMERCMIELSEDSVFEQEEDYAIMSARTLHHNIAGGMSVGAERRRRHTLAGTGMSSSMSLSTPSPPKRPHRDPQQEHLRQQQQQLQNRWRHKLAAELSTADPHHHPNHPPHPSQDPSLPRDIVEVTATLQDLAAEASELAESLPDNLATSHLLAAHPGGASSPSQPGGPGGRPWGRPRT